MSAIVRPSTDLITVCPRCDGRTIRGLRYEPSGDRVAVLLCLKDGYENPPFGACCTDRTNAHPREFRDGGVAVCVRCATPLTRKQAANRQAFCGHDCYRLSKRRPVFRTCPCGVPFIPSRRLVMRGGGIYHDRACYEQIRQSRKVS